MSRVFVVLAALAGVVAQAAVQFGGALPLWELPGSPVLLLPGWAPPWPDTPRAMVIADITGDGRGELIVGGSHLHVISLREGKLATNYLYIPAQEGEEEGPGGLVFGVWALRAGDMDGDGRVDLVVMTGEGELWVLRNRPQRFERWADSPYRTEGNSFWLLDYDGDGDLDVWLGSESKVEVLHNIGFRLRLFPKTTVELEGNLRAGAVGSYAGASGLFLLTDRGLWFLKQRGEAPEHVLDCEGHALAVGNFIGTGRKDVGIRRGDEVWIYPGKEDGLGEPVVIGFGCRPTWLLAGDLNGDGSDDLVAGSSDPAGFSVTYTLPGGGFLGPFCHGLEIPQMRGLPASTGIGTLGDVTGDGRDDLAVVGWIYYVSLFTAQPQMTRSLQAMPGSFILGSVDMDGDAHPDLLSDTAPGGVAVLRNSGWGTFKTEPLVGPSGEDRQPYIARLGDVTGDGKDELVVWEFAETTYSFWDPQEKAIKYETSNANVTVWDLQRSELFWTQPTGALVRPILELFDLDGDGIQDAVTVVGTKLLGLNFDPSRREMPPHFGKKRTEVETGGMVGPVVEVRLGGEERLALLRLGERAELLLVRPGGELEETGVSLELAPLDLTKADMNGDDNEDLVAIGWAAQEETLVIAVAVLWGDGQGGFQAQLYPLEGWPPLALPFPYGGFVAADLDGDGRPELAAMRIPAQEGEVPGGIVVIPWDEAGPGELSFLPSCVGTRLFALDLDGDGKAELISVQTGIPPQLCLVKWEVGP